MSLSEKYSEMYGEGQNFSENVNKNVLRNMEYTNNDFNNGNNMNNINNMNNGHNGNNGNNINNMNNGNNTNQTSSGMFYLFIFILCLGILFSVFYFKDTIIQLYRDLMHPLPNVNHELRQLKKSMKEEKEKRDTKEKETELKSKKEKGGVNTLVNKINSNQISKDDGYCYIGYDRGMRSCTELYEGDKCMSGEIFPSLEVCMFPNLRE